MLLPVAKSLSITSHVSKATGKYSATMKASSSQIRCISGLSRNTMRTLFFLDIQPGFSLPSKGPSRSKSISSLAGEQRHSTQVLHPACPVRTPPPSSAKAGFRSSIGKTVEVHDTSVVTKPDGVPERNLSKPHRYSVFAAIAAGLQGPQDAIVPAALNAH